MCVFFEFFCTSKFHQHILKVFSANAASTKASFLRQICWNSGQNSFDSSNSRLPPKGIYVRSIDSSSGLHLTNIAIDRTIQAQVRGAQGTYRRVLGREDKLFQFQGMLPFIFTRSF